jgi:hypothetical protein
MNNQLEIQDNNQIQDNQLEIQDNHQMEVVIQLHNNSVLLLPILSARFVNQICYLIAIENYNLGNIYPIANIMEIFTLFIKNKKLTILNNMLPDWLACIIYTFEPNLIRHAQTMNLYNNEFIDVINELKTFLPNSAGIIWDLPNNEKDYILRTLDNDTFRKLFTIIVNVFAGLENI